jgi:hypothetical protein
VGRVAPEDTEKLEFAFLSKEDKEVNGSIMIHIRGHKSLKLNYHAKPIIPKVVIEEEEFNFDEITFG